MKRNRFVKRRIASLFSSQSDCIAIRKKREIQESQTPPSKDHRLQLPPLQGRFRRRKDPLRNYTDISDHMDDAPPTADDLEDDERDLISLLSNLFCLAIFAVLSFFL